MGISDIIKEGITSVGIEFGSTRIKAVLIGEDYSVLASGAYDWENKLKDGIWTYSEDEIKSGLQGCFSALKADIKEKYDVTLDKTASMGISAMMHGYLAFDEKGELLVPFRTWRNTITEQAADILTEKFGFNIPQRWSIAHLYQAILNNEEHVSKIRFITTLAGYVHWLLTGKKTIGIGDGSGMFPIDVKNGCYNKEMLAEFEKLTSNTAFKASLSDILPEIVPVGECAGILTKEGALILDPTGAFESGVPFCPPEGDAQTGMVATNSIAPRTGNVSAGTSIFAMSVLEKDLSSVYRQIDIVTTPCGNPVAMVHCNNCSTELDCWVRLFGETLKTFGVEVSKSELYDKLYAAALSGETDCGGIISCNYHSGEHVTGFTEGRPFVLRSPSSALTLPNFMRSLIYSCMSTLKIGMDILINKEKIRLDKIYAHGGLFKSPITGQRFLAAALGVPVALMESAGEGGAWGIAILASYLANKADGEALETYLEKRVFEGKTGKCMPPDENDMKGFETYIEQYRKGLAVEEKAISM